MSSTVNGVTVRDYLLSKMIDEDSGLSTGYETIQDDIYGSFKSPHDIIKDNKDEFFNNIKTTVELSDRFKTDFCLRFYNKKIGYPVFSQFFLRLNDLFNSECYNMLRMLERLRYIDEKDMLSTTDMSSHSDFNSSSKGLSLGESTPETDKEITYNQTTDNLIIKYADSIGENRGYNEGENNSKTTGRNTNPLFDELNRFALMQDLQEAIFDIVSDRCFSTLY